MKMATSSKKTRTKKTRSKHGTRARYASSPSSNFIQRKVKGLPRNAVWSRTVPAICLAGLVCMWMVNATPAQQPQQPMPPVPPEQPKASTQNPAASRESSSSKKKKQPPGFLIIGTVFDDKALSVPGIDVRVRLKGEKKFRWETYTNSRGEFAVRVPEGPDYEVFVHLKHFQDASQVVSAKGGEIQGQLSIRLEPVKRDKGGEKK
jgi:hypothetical protein